ncbi:MAG: hypothetical protein R6U98_02800 [Pirellulaceae bacterium]
MKFSFHIGTEKTGSSYLQSLCALGREELSQSGIWFARGSAYDERCMATGQISAGNGRDLAQRMRVQRWDLVKGQLNTAVDEAQRRGCETVLFSSEWLLSVFAERTLLEPFIALVQELGSEKTRFLLVLRDPVEQFLSLYKHRAKRGMGGDVAAWAQGGYRLPHELAGFRVALRDFYAELVVRKYGRESGALDELFFRQWLNIEAPDVEVPAAVNPSLTLSELELVRLLAERRPSLVIPLYDRFLAMDPKRNVQGRELEAFARGIAERAVAAHRDEWAEWNALLPASEQLVIPQPVGELPPEPREIAFSKMQMEALMGFLAESVEPRFLAKLLWSAKIRPFLAGIKRVILPATRR